MVEVKADALEASFEAIEREHEDVEALKVEVAALKARVEAGALAAARPPLSGVKAEASPFVERYLRQGIESGVELKALSGTSDAAGGYAVPEEIDAAIDRTLAAISPIRAIANVVKVGSAGYRKLVTHGGTPSGWVSETALRPETDTPGFEEIAPPFGELYANPAASQAMLDDAAFDVEAWLAQEIATEFARAEGAAFVSGNGTSKPKGFLAAANSAANDASRPFGTLQFLATGAGGAFPASNPQDKLIDLVQALRTPYRQGAVFVMNSATAARIRKFKTSDGAFLWQPGLQAGQPDSLLGYPVIEAEDMPDIAADSLSIAFGNFKAGYLIAERSETQILRDPFTNKPFVHFYATTTIDIMLHPVVEQAPLDTPPVSPAVGQCWIVGATPTGAWETREGSAAMWSASGWRFVAPVPGLAAWNSGEGQYLYWDGATWTAALPVGAVSVDGVQVVGTRQPGVASPSGGTVIDVEARSALDQVIAALMTHGLIE